MTCLSVKTVINNHLGCMDFHKVGDGVCNDETNHMECNYDGGDCCGDNVNVEHCKKCLCLSEGILFYTEIRSYLSECWNGHIL